MSNSTNKPNISKNTKKEHIVYSMILLFYIGMF